MWSQFPASQQHHPSQPLVSPGLPQQSMNSGPNIPPPSLSAMPDQHVHPQFFGQQNSQPGQQPPSLINPTSGYPASPPEHPNRFSVGLPLRPGNFQNPPNLGYHTLNMHVGMALPGPGVPATQLEQPSSVFVPCNIDRAVELLGKGIPQRIKEEIGLSSIGFDGSQFEVSGSNAQQVKQASELLQQYIHNAAQPASQQGDFPTPGARVTRGPAQPAGDTSPAVRWKWLDDSGVFADYPSECQTTLERAYQEKRKEVIITNDGKIYSVSLEGPFVQVAADTQVSRTVKRYENGTETQVQHSEAQPAGLWYWRRTNWIGISTMEEYSPEVSRQIESAYQAQQQFTLIQGSNGKSYLVDFNRMEQFNEMSQHPRKIIRK